MKNGTIILYNYRDGINWWINLFNKIKYFKSGPTHSSIIGYQDKDIYYIYEATAKGVVCNKYEKWWVHYKCKEGVLEPYEVSEETFDIKRCCDKQLGKKYAIIDLLCILFGFRVDFTKKKRVICSEVIALIIKDITKGKANLSEEFNVAFSFITPMNLKRSKFIKHIKL